MKFTATEIRPDVYHFSFCNGYLLSSTFMRLQEFYESPYEDIRGQYFSHEKYMDLYAANTKNGEFTYFTDWSGFNVPGHIVLNFYKIFRYNLGLKERMLFEILLMYRNNKTKSDKFYLIGTYKSSREESCVNHEISHAYWYLYPKLYAEKSKALMKRVLSDKEYTRMRNILAEKGYTQEVFDDEIMAYLATSSKAYLQRNFKISKEFRVPDELKDFYKKFDAQQKSTQTYRGPNE